MLKYQKSSVVIIAFAMTLLGMTACNSNSEKPPTERMEDISLQMENEMSDLKAEMEQVKEELDRELARIETQLAQAEGETKVKLEDAKSKLEKEGDKLSVKMDQLSQGIDENWEEFKADTKQLARNIENSIKALSLEDA